MCTTIPLAFWVFFLGGGRVLAVSGSTSSPGAKSGDRKKFSFPEEGQLQIWEEGMLTERHLGIQTNEPFWLPSQPSALLPEGFRSTTGLKGLFLEAASSSRQGYRERHNKTDGRIAASTLSPELGAPPRCCPTLHLLFL